MCDSSEIIKFYIFLPIVHEEMPEQIFVENVKDRMIFIARNMNDIEYKWNIYDEYKDLRYKMYAVSILKDNNRDNIILKCFFPTYLIDKVGIHRSHWSPFFPYIHLICNFNASKDGFFDHNVIDFTPKILINNREKLKIFIYRPTFTDIKKEINCICYIEY